MMADFPDASFKARLRRREPLVGTLLTLPSPEVAEICARAGFDWLFVDMEHGLLDFAAVQRMIQAAGSCPCIVRVPMNEPIWIAKALDTGAAGVICPHISTAEEARQAMRAGRYPPAGTRSIGVARAQGFGTRVQDSVDSDNDAVVLVPQAEHIDAARHIGEIVAVPGVDAIFIGPFDLSASMGKPGHIGDVAVQAAIGTIRDACAAAGIASGIFTVDTESARKAIREGYSLVCVATDTLLFTRAAAELVRQARG
jgi:2-dehydro-3-deoxyglucarate aldolase/4-hydroxy-2-oxoheptanedioate aldolase